MKAHECYHCKKWIEENEPHDCWTTTEGALTKDLPEDLQDAYERLRETVSNFGEQRIYASHSSIMFSRTACYFFVRPKPKYLELCFFLGRPLKAPHVRSRQQTSKTKIAHTVCVTHRDEVEPPLTDWLHEAYTKSDELTKAARAGRGKPGMPRKRTDRGRSQGHPRATRPKRM